MSKEMTTLDWQASAGNDDSFRGKGRQWVVGQPGRSQTLSKTRVPAVIQSPKKAETVADPQHSLQLTSSAADSPAKTSRWLESVKGWLASGADYGTSSIASLLKSLPVGFSSKTSLAFYPQTEDETWPSSFEGWKTSGIGGPTGFLTLNTSEFPNDAAVCSLSDVLEPSVPSKFYLSPRACRGILRRAEKRGKALPPSLERALVARTEQGSEGREIP